MKKNNYSIAAFGNISLGRNGNKTDSSHRHAGRIVW